MVKVLNKIIKVFASWVCSNCGYANDSNAYTCRKCGKS
jgi:ribosomal protein L40E